jgi:hypothetical protein
MNTRRDAENGDQLDAASLPTGSEITVSPVASPKDRLEYIAEMVQELKIISAQANCQVLADLLERAYREAVRQCRIGA